MDEGALTRILPESLDVAVVDMVDNIEATASGHSYAQETRRSGNHRKKPIQDERREILGIVGATRVVKFRPRSGGSHRAAHPLDFTLQLRAHWRRSRHGRSSCSGRADGEDPHRSRS